MRKRSLMWLACAGAMAVLAAPSSAAANGSSLVPAVAEAGAPEASPLGCAFCEGAFRFYPATEWTIEYGGTCHTYLEDACSSCPDFEQQCWGMDVIGDPDWCSTACIDESAPEPNALAEP